MKDLTMKRALSYHLQEWRTSRHRKPLLIRGARQVGKTSCVRELSSEFDSYAEINFELHPNAAAIFESDLDAHRIARDLSILCGTMIVPGETLLFLDEIQLAPRVLTALRYFYEMTPQLHVIAAGSQLGFAIAEVGMPVGRISSLYLYPMSFLEFCSATGNNLLARELITHRHSPPMSEPVHEKAYALLGQYMAVGGMPEAVAQWLEHQDLELCRRIHFDIIKSYRQDLDKYGTKYHQKHAGRMFEEVPRQMGGKFRYHAVHGDFRKRELAPAMDLLVKTSVVTKVLRSSAQGVPLGATADHNSFKPLFVDIALAQTALGIPAGEWILRTRDALANKGALTEAFVGQELLAYQEAYRGEPLYYWHRQARSSNAEVDYVIQRGGTIIPIEVKSGTTGWLRSMHRFLGEHPAVSRAVRLHGGNYSRDGKIESYPLYAVAGATGIDVPAYDYLLR